MFRKKKEQVTDLDVTAGNLARLIGDITRGGRGFASLEVRANGYGFFVARLPVSVVEVLSIQDECTPVHMRYL